MTQRTKQFGKQPYAAASGTTTGRRNSLLHPSAFTLIEILMVIVIIGIIIALVITGISALRGQTKVKQAQAMLEHLAAAETEYRAETGDIVPFTFDSYGNYDKTLDKTIGSSANTSIHTFLEYIESYPKPYEHVKKVGHGNNSNGAWGFNHEDNIVLDPWGKPIQYRSYSTGQNSVWPSATGNLPAHGSSNVPKPFFASAGPDGQWGSTDYTNNKPDGQAKDNLYSYEVMK